jgi:protoheme IX farnesyltransferase
MKERNKYINKLFRNYLLLTKPTIMILVILTGATALIVERSLLNQPLKFFLVLLALYLTGGSANALNQYFERHIDAQMSRTSKRRPLPLGKIEPMNALIFSISIGIAGILVFGLVFNWFTALLSFSTIIFYSLFYTLMLKPHTTQNVVIGGIAGAMAPVGAWAAATARTDIIPWIMFLIVFFWTPPHFWALALFNKEDYIKTKLPMLPLVKGESVTLKHIIHYVVLLLVVSIMLFFMGAGWLYLIFAVPLGLIFIKKSLLANRLRTERQYRVLFSYSILYLCVLFIIIILDSLVQNNST